MSLCLGWATHQCHTLKLDSVSSSFRSNTRSVRPFATVAMVVRPRCDLPPTTCAARPHPKTNQPPGSFVGGGQGGFGGDADAWTGAEEDCACPDFFEIDGWHMLLCISHPRGCRYYSYLGRLMSDGPDGQAPTFVTEEKSARLPRQSSRPTRAARPTKSCK